MLAEINKLKLSYTTYVEVEHARAEINSKIKSPEGTMREGPPFPINSWNKISQIHLKSLTLEKERGEKRNWSQGGRKYTRHEASPRPLLITSRLSIFHSEHRTNTVPSRLRFASTQASRSRHLSSDLLGHSASIPAGILPRVLRPKPGNRPLIFRSSTRVNTILDRPDAKSSRASARLARPPS